jgi:L-malate glycosyltransferase
MSARPECTGICRIITSLGRYTNLHGHDVSVLFLKAGPLIGQMQAAGISANAIPWNGTPQDLVGAVRVFFWMRRNRPAIIHLHWGGRMVRAICKLSGAKVVIQHVHGLIDENTGEVPKELSFPWADAVVACSKAVAAGVTSHKAEVVYAGILVDPKPQPLTDHTGPLQIGVLSRLTPIKNIDRVIEAAAQLRDAGIEIHVDIAGSGPSEPELRNIADKLDVADKIRFLGWQKNISELLAGWDLLVMPSIDEGFSLSTLEAMAAARPVIASRVGGIPEIVVDGITGYLIPPNDTDALVQRISELANDRARLAEMGLSGWKRAQAEFSEEALARKMAHFYDQLYESD